jgi:hypothetical protein
MFILDDVWNAPSHAIDFRVNWCQWRVYSFRKYLKINGLRHATPIWAIGAPDSGLLTDAPNPFICASRRITTLSGSSALEPDGKNVRSPAKQRPEQLNLSLRRRTPGDQMAILIQIFLILGHGWQQRI